MAMDEQQYIGNLLMRVATLRGMVALRDDLNAEILAMTGQMATAVEEPKKIAPPRRKSGGRMARPPSIGYGTNAEWIYHYMIAHGNEIILPQACLAASKSRTGHNLGGRMRMSVAVGSMKRRGFVEKLEGTGRYRLTPFAVETYEPVAVGAG